VDDLGILVAVEEIFEREPTINPKVATTDPAIYMSTHYDPTQQPTDVVAFVQTQDGSRFPMVMVPVDNALDKGASVDRTEIPDFDRATVNRLEAVGLAGLPSFVSAPANLVAAVLGQSLEYTQSLASDSMTTLQEDVRNGYMAYPGINKAQSDSLKAQFGGPADLANASIGNIAQVLEDAGISAAVSNSLATRFRDDVRQMVPTDAYALTGTTISAQDRTTLGEMGIDTNKDFLDAAADPASREELINQLGISEATLDRYVEEAAVDLARGQFFTAPDVSVGALPGMTADMADRLAAQGINSGKKLSNADPVSLAGATGVTVEEMTGFVDEAATHAPSAHITLINAATRNTVPTDVIEGAGYNTAGAVRRTDVAGIEATMNVDNATANNVVRMMDSFLGDEGRLYRPGR
jgi:hypothetical protein